MNGKSDPGTALHFKKPSGSLIQATFCLVVALGGLMASTEAQTSRLVGTVVGWGEQVIPGVAPGTHFTNIAAGGVHNLALKPGGTVVAWGDNEFGQSIVPPGLNGITTVAGGAEHSLALKSDGTVVAWGANEFGQRTMPAGLRGVTAIVCGEWHSLALKSNGTVAAWGSPSYASTVPAGLSGVSAIAAGGWHSLALASNGTVVAWGNTDPAPAGLNNVVAIAAGRDHNLALKSDGTIVGWGDNSHGQTSVPARLGSVIAIAAGGFHSLALKSDGTVVAWGDTMFGLNDVPTNLTAVVAIAAGQSHNLALTSDGRVVCWGDNQWAQCLAPGELSDCLEVAAGGQHSLALKPDGSVIAWGVGSSDQGRVPAGLSGVTGIAAGDNHCLALKADGTVVAWGWNDLGATTVPLGLSGVVTLAGGVGHSLALKADGTVVGWGYNANGQTNVPPGLSAVMAIAAGSFHSLALKAGGTVVAWGAGGPGQVGDPNYGQSTVPVGLSNVIAIAAGGYHSLALRADGTVVAWGWNNAGQTSVPADLINVIAITAEGQQSLALKSDRTVVVWGRPVSGGGPAPAGLDNVIAIAAGYSHTLALVAENTNGAPVIAVAPQSQTPDVGSSAHLVVRVLGAEPLAYQWFFNNTTPISGATNAVLQLTNIQLSQSGAYSVLVTNALGAVTSSPAIVTVTGSLPTILAPPLSQTVNVGESVDFTVSALGSLPLGYQWFFEGKAIAGATGTVLSLNAIQLPQAGPYTVVVTNAFGAVTSAPAILTMIVPPQTNRPAGTVVGWGNNDHGQCNVPPGLSNVVAIAAGREHALALKSDGTVVAWGENSSGQANVPTDLRGVIGIAAGAEHSLAVKYDGLVIAWGNNSEGQSTVPTGLSDVVAVAAGDFHSLALRSDGTVLAWGHNYYGQTDVPPGLNDFSAIAAGAFHSLALRANGTVVAWGADAAFNPNYGQSIVPEGLTNIVAISAGAAHSLALQADGAVVGWGAGGPGQSGDPNYGQSAPPTDLQAVMDIAAGGYHSLALKADSKVVGWGFDGNGQADVPPDLGDVIAVAAGQYFSLVLVGQSPFSQPFIRVPPGSQTADVGTTVDFVVNAIGTRPLAYQWFFNATNLLSGATFPRLELPNVQLSQSGAYTVAVTNSFGAITSSPAILTVIASPPAILAPPLNQTAEFGGSVDFSVGAAGSPPLAYQWFFEGSSIPSATGMDLHLADLQLSQAGPYVVVVTNAFGAITSPPAILTVVASPPTILTSPISQTANVGGAVDFVVTVAGSPPLTYQWFFNDNAIAGASNPTLHLADLQLSQSGTYTLVVTNLFGAVTSSPATLSVVLVQGFQNLDFEEGSLVPVPGDLYERVDFSAALPGWTGYCGTNRQSLANYNNMFLDSAGISILDTNFSRGLNHGRFCVLLQAGLGLGPPAPGPPVDTSLAQTGVVPAEAKSITFNAWIMTVSPPLSGTPLEVTFDGMPIPIRVRVDHGTYAEMEGDVSAFAGQTGELRFTAPVLWYIDQIPPRPMFNNFVWLDYIRFSSSPPANEPSLLAGPISQTAEAGTTIGFRVLGSGSQPLTYQWFFNGTNAIDGGGLTSSVLRLVNVEPAQAGAYTLVIANLAGAATSAPALLSVIPPVERRLVPALTLIGPPHSVLNLDTADVVTPAPNWAAFDSLALTNVPQWYFDLSSPLKQRFYRAWQSSEPNVIPPLDIHMIPALTLTGAIGSTLRVEGINQFGPTDAWFPLATVTLTNTSQLYFDTSTIGQPPRLWRIMAVPH